jgi:hypothetical protein
MSLFRRDIISIARINVPIAKGAQPEQGLPETVIFTGVKADIQRASTTMMPRAKLPGDVDLGMLYIVHFNLPPGSMKVRDMIINAAGERFQVLYPYWTLFNYQCSCKLEQM